MMLNQTVWFIKVNNHDLLKSQIKEPKTSRLLNSLGI